MNFLIIGVLMFFFWTLVLSDDFGNIVNIDTTGASEATARQDGLTETGVAASNKLAEHELERMNEYKHIIKEVAREINIEPALIAGIISRESRAGAALVNGKGDNGNAFGLMQVDKNCHKPEGEWDSEENIRQGTQILFKQMKAIQRKFPKWTKDQQLKDCAFGDLMQITTTGASAQTASQDSLPIGGVAASHQLAATDLQRMDQYKTIIMQAARDTQMDPAVIAGIISRETRAGAHGSELVDGWGDHGNAFGLMQIDKRHHNPVGAWNSVEHIIQATHILITFIQAIQEKFPNWSKEDQFKGGIAAYNAGPESVSSHEAMDVKTTGQDYANDVVARAQWFKSHGYSAVHLI